MVWEDHTDVAVPPDNRYEHCWIVVRVRLKRF